MPVRINRPSHCALSKRIMLSLPGKFPGDVLPLSSTQTKLFQKTKNHLQPKRSQTVLMNNQTISPIQEALRLRIYSASALEKDPLLIIDAANVVGTVPNGWWRDRFGAALKLRDRLASLHALGLRRLRPPMDVMLVTEGAACGVRSNEFVAVVGARGSGDNEIVWQVRAASRRDVVVVTSDIELQERISAVGASYISSMRFINILDEFSQGNLSYSFYGNPS